MFREKIKKYYLHILSEMIITYKIDQSRGWKVEIIFTQLNRIRRSWKLENNGMHFRYAIKGNNH